MTADTTASPLGAEPRAFVFLKSRRRLDLLNPDPHVWTDDDLAAGPLAYYPMGRGVTPGTWRRSFAFDLR